ncbi:DUF6634 family protein [Devosia nitrariae]|uniref:DUF6634 family protein n=1 Tax=Devosia nitrariae TaxID=2071872 RepID=UPI0035EBE8A6
MSSSKPSTQKSPISASIPQNVVIGPKVRRHSTRRLTEGGEFAGAAALVEPHQLLTEARGAGPTVEELTRAPLLRSWQPVEVTSLALTGLALDHPNLGTAFVTTSQVYAVAPDWSWVRTLSRYHLLGSSDAA